MWPSARKSKAILGTKWTQSLGWGWVGCRLILSGPFHSLLLASKLELLS